MAILKIKTLSQNSIKKGLIIDVGSRVLKKATERNLIKRRIKSIMIPVIKETGKVYKIIITSPKVLELSFEGLEREIKNNLLGLSKKL